MDLNDAISAAATLAAVGDQRINTILDFFFTTIRLDKLPTRRPGCGIRSPGQSVTHRWWWWVVGGSGQSASQFQTGGWGEKTVPRSTTQSQTVAGRQCPGQSVSLRQMEDVPRSVSQSQTVGGRAQVSQSDTDRCGDVPRSVSQSQTDGGRAQVSQSVTDSWGDVPRSVSQTQTDVGRAQVSQSVTDRWRTCPGQSVSHRHLGGRAQVSQTQTDVGRAQVSQSVTDSWGTCPGQSVRHRQMGEVPRSVSQSRTVGGT